MSPDMMAQLKFLLTDVGQILKLILIVTVPVALVAAVGIWLVMKRIKRR
jgi:hypothetical protein